MTRLFEDDCTGVQTKMPDGTTKLYIDQTKWSLQDRQSDDWLPAWGPVPFKDGYSGMYSGNDECEVYCSPFSNGWNSSLAITERFDPFVVDAKGYHIKPGLFNRQQILGSNQYGLAPASDAFGSGIITGYKKQPALQSTPGNPLVFRALVTMGSARGLWPAWWLLTDATVNAWPPEIDIFELLTSHETQLHSGVISTKGTSSDWYTLPNGTTWANGEQHKIAAILDADKKTFEVHCDNITLQTFDCSNYPDLFGPLYQIFNVAVGGKWAFNELNVPPTDGVTPMRMAQGIDLISPDYTSGQVEGLIISKVTVDNNVLDGGW